MNGSFHIQFKIFEEQKQIKWRKNPAKKRTTTTAKNSFFIVFEKMEGGGERMRRNEEKAFQVSMCVTQHKMYSFWLLVSLHKEKLSKKSGSNSGLVGGCTMYDFHDSTDTLKFWTEKIAINKTILFFIWFWWNLVKLLHIGNYNFTKFHQNQMKNI